MDNTVLAVLVHLDVVFNIVTNPSHVTGNASQTLLNKERSWLTTSKRGGMSGQGLIRRLGVPVGSTSVF